MRSRASFVRCIALVIACAASDCDQIYPARTPEYEGGVGCTDDDTDPNTTVSWANDIEMAIIQRETYEGPGCSCHLPTASPPLGIQMGGLDLESFDTLMQGGFHSRTDIVVPGHPCQSVLYLKITNPPFGARMPRMGGYLSPREIALFHDWIAEGAHEY